MAIQSCDGFDEVLAGIPSCALAGDTRERQAARYQRVTSAVARVLREPRVVHIDFDAHVHLATIDELIAVERECCPSLGFSWNQHARRLSITAPDPSMSSALDTIEAGLRGALG